jgi:S1-C subfamily serine protease
VRRVGGGCDGKLTGINFVDKQPIRQNATTYRKRVLTDNQPHELVCTVHRRHVRFTLDGNTVFDWSGRASQLRFNGEYWSKDDFPANRLVLASWKTAWRIRKLELAPIISSPWNDLSLASTSDSMKKSIALIETETGSGSGFVAGHNLVATNHHVIEDATFDEMSVYFGDDIQPLPVKRILASSKRNDLAILEVETNSEPLPIAWDGVFPKGELVNVHGNPSIESNVLLRGASVAGTVQSRLRLDGQDYMQIAANVNPGSSGGPVLNQSGQVVGVVVMKATNDGETLLREASRQFDAGVQSNQSVGRHGVAIAIPGSVLIQTLKEVGDVIAQRARETTAHHDAVAVIGRALKVASYDYLRLIGNAPQRVLAQARRSQSSNAPLAMPPDDVYASIRDFTQSESFMKDLASLRKELYERLPDLYTGLLLDDETKERLRDFRVQLSRLEKFADQPSGTYARFERTASDLGANLQRLSMTLRESLRRGLTM